MPLSLRSKSSLRQAASINASTAGRHRSTVYRGAITLPPLRCPGSTFGLHPRIGDSGEKIESSKASVLVVTRFCGARARAGALRPVSSTEDSCGADGVPLTGQSPVAHAPASTAYDVFLPFIRRSEAGMNLAVFHRDGLKKATSLERGARSGRSPSRAEAGGAAMPGAGAPHTQRIRARELATPGVHASGMIPST